MNPLRTSLLGARARRVRRGLPRAREGWGPGAGRVGGRGPARRPGGLSRPRRRSGVAPRGPLHHRPDRDATGGRPARQDEGQAGGAGQHERRPRAARRESPRQVLANWRRRARSAGVALGRAPVLALLVGGQPQPGLEPPILHAVVDQAEDQGRHREEDGQAPQRLARGLRQRGGVERSQGAGSRPTRSGSPRRPRGR